MLDSCDLLVNDHHVNDFVYELIHGTQGGFGPCSSLGWLNQQGLLEAGVVFHNYHKDYQRIELSAASLNKYWLSVNRLNTIADYAFKQLNCYTLLVHHDPSNRVARRLWKRIGGHEFILPNLRGKNKDDCMHVLTADEARQSKFWRD